MVGNDNIARITFALSFIFVRLAAFFNELVQEGRFS